MAHDSYRSIYSNHGFRISLYFFYTFVLFCSGKL